MEDCIKLLEEVSHEVKDLHPILHSTFLKVKEFTHVEYHQGPSEYGADFVIEKQNEILDDKDFIGVVVKKGKITQNSIDVERQIEQCITMPRVIRGNVRVDLSEIWVVTSSTFSQNAKQYFSKKYKSTKISFLDKNALAKFIDKYNPELAAKKDVEVLRCAEDIRNKIEQLQNSSAFSLETSSHITSEIRRVTTKKYSKKKGHAKRSTSRVSAMSLVESNKTSLIEGPMGSGKSNLLRNLALDVLKKENFQKLKQIPIYITLGDLEKRFSSSLPCLVEEYNNKFNLHDNTEISFLVLLDGVDETKHNLNERISVLKDLSTQANAEEKIKLVISGRELDENSVEVHLSSHIDRYEIAPLSLKQIVSFIREVCTSLNVSGKIIEDIGKSNLFRMLPKTPISAILLAKLLEENQSEIPSNLTELYSKYVELSLGRWDIEKGLKQQKEYEASVKIIQNISQYLLEHNIPCIGVDEAKGFFRSYLGERNLGLNVDEVFDNLVNRSDIIVLNDDEFTFSFKHRTFVEFFYASKLNSVSGKEVTEESFEIYWATVNFFWTGLKKDCPSILKEFCAVKATYDRTKILKMINFGNLLLAGYQSPYDAISECVVSSFIETAQYFNDLRSQKIESPLQNFPEMHLLSIFRHIASEGYGYEFFKPAIEDALIIIGDNKELSYQDKAVALFLLGATYISIGGGSVFDGLIDNVGTQAPISIQLAIQHEVENHKITSGKTNKIHRNLKRLASDRGMNKKFKELYDRSIDSMKVV